MQENFNVRGTLDLVLKDADGNIKEERHEKNLIVTVGLAHVVSRLKDATATVMTHMGLGSGSTAAATAQTDLVSALGSRVVFDDAPTLLTTTTANDTIQFVATFPAGTGTGAVIEAGIFNAITAGTMLSRTVFASGVINKGALDSLTITWKIRAA